MDQYNTRQTLIAKIREKHNDQAWEEFSCFYKAYIYSIIIRMGVMDSDRDDLVQKILFEIWKSMTSFKYEAGTGRFRNWVFGVARLQALMHFRTNKRYQKKLTKIQEMADTGETYESEMDAAAEDEWQTHIFHIAWDRIKDDLPESYRECFMLFGQGLDVHEVCARLDIKKNSAHVYRQRVLKRLNREIRFLDDELG